MTISRNTPGFAHHNLSLKVVAREGPNARKPFTVTAAESVKLDAGGKVNVMKGLSVGPITVTNGAAEPSFEWKASMAEQSAKLAKHLGGSEGGAIGILFDLVAVWSRKGMETRTYEAKGCLIEKGLVFDTSSDSGPSDTVSGKCTDILIDGISIFPKPSGG